MIDYDPRAESIEEHHSPSKFRYYLLFVICFVAVVVFIAFLGSHGQTSDSNLEEAKTESWDTGYEIGYEEGYYAGYSDCVDDDFSTYSEAYNTGKELGYSEGFSDGSSASGFETGFDNGYYVGYDEGRKSVVSDAYNAGYRDGHADGRRVLSYDGLLLPIWVIVVFAIYTLISTVLIFLFFVKKRLL